jgi:hypothetical protein
MCEKCEIHPNIRLVGEILALHEWHMEKSKQKRLYQHVFPVFGVNLPALLNLSNENFDAPTNSYNGL